MPANVKSIDTIRQFRADLVEYRDALRQALDILSAEVTRALEYFESDRARYWPTEIRRASDQVAAARIQLQRCQVSGSRSGEGPSCVDEKKALARAKARLETAHQKVKATRHWIQVVRKEVDAFQTRLAQLRFLVDHETPRALTVLARMAARLERYAQKLDVAGGPPDANVTPPR